MSNKQIVGVYFFQDKTVNRQNYSQMLKNYFDSIMQRKILNNKMIFQQYGAPPHFPTEARTWLNEKFNGRWIGRGGPISWPRRSPDLTPLDFFLWEYIKTKVYKTKVNDISNLKEKGLNKKLRL